ncbi:MAG: hypothetical protein ACTS8W_01890 [Arsenophonus sp. NC-PY1-MAG3]
MIEQSDNNLLVVVITGVVFQDKTSLYPYRINLLDCFIDPELEKSVYIHGDYYWLISRQFRIDMLYLWK